LKGEESDFSVVDSEEEVEVVEGQIVVKKNNNA